jgi:hypothetical protein
VDGNGRVYLQNKGEKYQTFHLNWGEKLWWKIKIYTFLWLAF